eukprot:6407846-Amphidinium_carterae.1
MSIGTGAIRKRLERIASKTLVSYKAPLLGKAANESATVACRSKQSLARLARNTTLPVEDKKLSINSAKLGCNSWKKPGMRSRVDSVLHKGSPEKEWQQQRDCNQIGEKWGKGPKGG